MTLLTVFFQMLALLIMIGVGCFATKTGMMDENTNNHISRLIVNIFNPLLVFSSAANSVGTIPLDTMLLVCLIAAGMFAFLILAGMILSPLFEKDRFQRKIFQLMFVFSNLGFIGIPVVSSILGAQYVVYVTEFMMIYTVLFYTYGMALMDGKFTLSSLKAMLNSGTFFSVAALVVIIFNINLPDFIKISATYLGNATSPLALMAVGFSLARADLRSIFGNLRLYLFSVVKLLALPLLMLPLLRLATNDPGLIGVSMVMFGMPVGNMPLMLGTQKGIDCTNCSAAIILTTILCVITIPILMAVVG